MAARKTKILHDDKTKDAMRGSSLVRMLTEVAEKGTYMGAEVSDKRITAAKTVLPFIRPALQSVEQTVVDQRDGLDETALLAQLNGLFSAKPELFNKIIALRQAAALVAEGSQAISTAAAPQQQHSSILT